ncbi:MAG: stage III sporulation protein AF [Firmicutes bacterium]|nr:stage III sporulation protein AF [Bacillota bacterium]
MQWLSDVARNLIALVFFVSVAQLLLPESGLKGYARMVMGLVIVAGVLGPVLELFRLDYDLQRHLFLETPLAAADPYPYIERGLSIAQTAQAQLTRSARSRFADQVASVAALAAGDFPAEASVEWEPDGSPGRIRLRVNAGPGDPRPDPDRIRRVVAQFFGMSPGQIDVGVTVGEPGPLQ